MSGLTAPGAARCIVALHEGDNVFVEVKTKPMDIFGALELAVTPQKVC